MVNTVLWWWTDSHSACRGKCLGSAEQSDLAVMQPHAHHPRLPAAVPGFTKNIKLLAKLWKDQSNLQRMVEISGFPSLLPVNRYFSSAAHWLACEVFSYKRKAQAGVYQKIEKQ